MADESLLGSSGATKAAADEMERAARALKVMVGLRKDYVEGLRQESEFEKKLDRLVQKRDTLMKIMQKRVEKDLKNVKTKAQQEKVFLKYKVAEAKIQKTYEVGALKREKKIAWGALSKVGKVEKGVGAAKGVAGAIGGGVGGITGALGKAGPYGMIAAAIIDAVKSLFEFANKANKEMVKMRRSIYEDVGAFDTLAFSMQGNVVSFGNLKDQFDKYTDALQNMTILTREQMTLEERMSAIGGFKKAGTKINEVTTEIVRLNDQLVKGIPKAWEELTKKDPTVIVRRRALLMGEDIGKVAERFADFSYSTGTSLLRVDKLFDQVYKHAIKSGLATNQFVSEIQSVTANMNLFIYQITMAAEELEKLSRLKGLTAKEQKELFTAYSNVFEKLGMKIVPLMQMALKDKEFQGFMSSLVEKADTSVKEALAALEEAKKTGDKINIGKAESELARAKKGLGGAKLLAKGDAFAISQYAKQMPASMQELIVALTGVQMGFAKFGMGAEEKLDPRFMAYLKQSGLTELQTGIEMLLTQYKSSSELIADRMSTQGGAKEDEMFKLTLGALSSQFKTQVEPLDKILGILETGILTKIYTKLDQIYQWGFGILIKMMSRMPGARDYATEILEAGKIPVLEALTGSLKFLKSQTEEKIQEIDQKISSGLKEQSDLGIELMKYGAKPGHDKEIYNEMKKAYELMGENLKAGIIESTALQNLGRDVGKTAAFPLKELGLEELNRLISEYEGKTLSLQERERSTSQIIMKMDVSSPNAITLIEQLRDFGRKEDARASKNAQMGGK